MFKVGDLVAWASGINRTVFIIQYVVDQRLHIRSLMTDNYYQHQPSVLFVGAVMTFGGPVGRV